MTPAAVPPALEEEMRKLKSHIEAIRRSVEFTEAHVAVNGSLAAASKSSSEAVVDDRGRGWAVPFLIAGNLILLVMLLTEIRDDRVGAAFVTLYQACAAILAG